jgi:Calcineurin-like phosphoesterase
MDRYRRHFGDDYFTFWTNGSYNIVLNTNVFNNPLDDPADDPTEAYDIYVTQLKWLEDRLSYARCRAKPPARNIFVFGHHPWFLYEENEVAESMTGVSPVPTPNKYIADSYFHIPLPYRQKALQMFRQYHVTAAFSGHFHQNLVSQTSWGMPMIITSSLSMILDSTGKPPDSEPSTQGIRLVRVSGGADAVTPFQHEFIPVFIESES